MKNIAKISQFIFIIALYQTSYSSEYGISQSNSPTGEMFRDVLSQPATSPVEAIFSPLSLQHPDDTSSDTIEKSASRDSEEYVYVQHNSTQTNSKTLNEEIEDLIQFHCNPESTNLFITGEINGMRYEFSTFNNQRNLALKKQIQEEPQKYFDSSTQIINEKIMNSTINEFIPLTSDRRKPSKRITYNPNKDTTNITENTNATKNSSTYFTTKNYLIGSLTVASVMTGYLILKNRK